MKKKLKNTTYNIFRASEKRAYSFMPSPPKKKKGSYVCVLAFKMMWSFRGGALKLRRDLCVSFNCNTVFYVSLLSPENPPKVSSQIVHLNVFVFVLFAQKQSFLRPKKAKEVDLTPAERNQTVDSKRSRDSSVYVVFIPVCRKCVYIDEANQGTNTFQEVEHH